MAIWGKILGSAAGFAMGGPLGALLGAVAGHVIDRGRGETPGEPGMVKQAAFALATVVLSAKMAKADGAVTRDEIDAFKEIFDVPPEEMKHVGRVFDHARKDATGFETYAKQLRRMFANEPAVLEELIAGLFHITKADGIAHPDEINFLKQVSDIFGFSDATFDRLKAAHLGEGFDDPYKVLGLTSDASDKEVRSTWRKLVREHHPDTLIAQGMPEDFIKLATDELAAVNDAYDRIAKQRGLT